MSAASAVITLWLVLLAVVCSVITGYQQRCPNTMPYAGCSCYEDPFQVRCNATANFTEGLPDSLPDCIVLKVNGVNMEVLSSVPYPNLASLSITNNNIRVVRDNVFAELTNLQTLTLSNNPIGEIKRETFQGLENVNFINMEDTRLYVVPSYTFVGKYMKQLEILRLGNSSLYDIKVHAFHMLYRLALLNISHNYLCMIPDFASSDELLNLTHLDLSFNQITSVNHGIFENLPRLQFLLLNNNKIQQIGSHSFAGLGATIVSIDLTYNVINDTSPTAFIGLTRLQSLYLNDNALTGLVWEELPWDNLINLVLHDNPWDCACHNSWLVESERIAIHNNNSNFLCATPPSVAHQEVLSVPDTTFACPRRSSHGHTALILGLGAALSLVVAALGALLLCRCMQRKQKGIEAGGSTPTSAYKRVHDDQGELILRT